MGIFTLAVIRSPSTLGINRNLTTPPPTIPTETNRNAIAAARVVYL